jgi:hypothetical protein
MRSLNGWSHQVWIPTKSQGVLNAIVQTFTLFVVCLDGATARESHEVAPAL